MASLFFLLPILSIMIGLNLVTHGLWELRLAENKNKYGKYMFSGLFLIIVLPALLFLIGNVINNFV
ncbi:hypothetical protein F9U64_10940 [Gracilibacillus oryzae]|uniref:Uncharacterized protein n=1 Tax=Gracilibacillus oryzae TaxID=1672701 RepID=A0A7C8KYD5_9BACI|nr:hypothetical protein [Gracilibacillus oryzae]KAB8135777.1 hypothetical protein F9U64_10940 [Gracilibacillus oryzae]